MPKIELAHGGCGEICGYLAVCATTHICKPVQGIRCIRQSKGNAKGKAHTNLVRRENVVDILNSISNIVPIQR